MAKKFNPIRTGVDPRKDAPKTVNGESKWLKIKTNEVVDVIPLIDAEDIIACEQCAIWLEDGNSPIWVYTGPEDPSHDLGIDRDYKAYMPVLVDGTPKIWGMSKTVHRTILDVADAGGDLKGMVLRVKRTGTGLATRYSIVPRGMRADVSKEPEVDVIEALEVKTPEEVREHIAKKLGLDSYEDVVKQYAGLVKSGATRRSAAAKTERTKSSDEEVDDLEL